MKQGSLASLETMGLTRNGEWLWGGIGLGIASLSACFAAYMLAFGPGETGVSSLADFGVFARMQSSEHYALTRNAPVLQSAGIVPKTVEARSAALIETASAAVDFAPTGSVSANTDTAVAKRSDGSGAAAPNSEQRLSSFILRDVFDGQALVESSSAITLVSKGSVITGAGPVLSIEKRGSQWVVVTSGGIIGGIR